MSPSTSKWSTIKALKDVGDERKHQLKKWGDQHHGHAWWLVIETEELGEVARAIFEWRDDSDAGLLTDQGRAKRDALIRSELVQVAAVAVAWIEDIDSREERL